MRNLTFQSQYEYATTIIAKCSRQTNFFVGGPENSGILNCLDFERAELIGERDSMVKITYKLPWSGTIAMGLSISFHSSLIAITFYHHYPGHVHFNSFANRLVENACVPRNHFRSVLSTNSTIRIVFANILIGQFYATIRIFE
jgi:hypothetical protein